MDYFEDLDLSSLSAIGWKLFSKSTRELPEEPDKVQVSMAFQSLRPHQCPICGQSHLAAIGASDVIAKDATAEKAKEIVASGWKSAIEAMLGINTRLANFMAQMQENLSGGKTNEPEPPNPDDSDSTSEADDDGVSEARPDTPGS